MLSLCLYDSENKLVPATVMDGTEEEQGWPPTMLTGLFDAAQDLSGLNEEARKKQEAEAKNS